MATKVWVITKDGDSMPTYYLNKEHNPLWFCKIYVDSDKRYVFSFGERVTDENKNPKRFFWNKKGFKSAATAKRKALEYINIKMLGL